MNLRPAWSSYEFWARQGYIARLVQKKKKKEKKNNGWKKDEDGGNGLIDGRWMAGWGCG